jgi:hypothetical protein
MQTGQWPLSVGFFFSLGHSIVVVLATAAIALSTATLRNQLDSIKDFDGLIGTTSPRFSCWRLHPLTLSPCTASGRIFKDVRQGEHMGAEQLDTLLAGHGFLTRLSRFWSFPLCSHGLSHAISLMQNRVISRLPAWTNKRHKVFWSDSGIVLFWLERGAPRLPR